MERKNRITELSPDADADLEQLMTVNECMLNDSSLLTSKASATSNGKDRYFTFGYTEDKKRHFSGMTVFGPGDRCEEYSKLAMVTDRGEHRVM